MSSVKKPQNWLCLVAFAAAFWITFRVMAADAPAQSTHSSAGEVDDAALDRLLARFASEAVTKQR